MMIVCMGMGMGMGRGMESYGVMRRVLPETYFRFGEGYEVDVESQRLTSSYEMALEGVMGVRMSMLHEASIVFLDDLNDMDIFLRVAGDMKNVKLVVGLRSINFFASKGHLGMILEKFLSEDEVMRTLPRTIPAYLIKDGEHKKERVKMVVDRLDKGPYILKTNRQRQVGIEIVMNPMNVVKKIEGGDYSVVQELLGDPYIVGGRKINIRVYIGIIKSPKKRLMVKAWHDGFVYYAPSRFDDENASIYDKNITTGYIDRSVYEENPLTLMDLRDHMGTDKYRVLWDDVERVIGNIEYAYESITYNMDRGGDFTRLAIMGVDFAVMKDLSVRLMEINKNPDTRGKSDRDQQLKIDMIAYFMNHAMFYGR